MECYWGTKLSLCIADKVIKVPQMAESISEGTLKQWVKRKKRGIWIYIFIYEKYANGE